MSNKNKTLLSLPKEERPRERLLKVGTENLSTAELLAIILSTGTQGSNVLEVAQELLYTIIHQVIRHQAIVILKLPRCSEMLGNYWGYP